MADEYKVKRDIDGICDSMFDVIDGIRNGTLTPAKGNAISRAAGTINEAARLKFEVAKYVAQSGELAAGNFLKITHQG